MLLAVLFYLDEGIGLLFPGLTACLVHELGHVLVIHIIGGKIERLELTASGAVLVLDTRYPLSYVEEGVSSFAGPMANFVCGGVAAYLGHYLTAGVNFAIGLFNLLPIWPMDGGRVLCSALSLFWAEERIDKCILMVSFVLVGGLFSIGFMLIREFGNPTLLVTSCILLICIGKNYFLK